MNTILAKAAIVAGSIAVASVATFLLVGSAPSTPDTEDWSPTESAEEHGRKAVSSADLPEGREDLRRADLRLAVDADFHAAGKPMIPAGKKTHLPQDHQPLQTLTAEVPSAREDAQPSLPAFAKNPAFPRNTAASFRASASQPIAELATTTRPPAKPQEPGEPPKEQITPEKPPQASESKKPELAAVKSSNERTAVDGAHRSAPNLTPQPSTPTRPPRVWPKPFTPEEERYRQQVGVQAYINLQHEAATGEVREE